MSDYTIAENFTIPSKGKIYKQQVIPDVKLRSMTTAHEMQRLSPSELPYKNMCDILDDCIVEGLGMSTYDLCIGDYLFLLHKLRVVTYGPEYKMNSVCPYCGSITESSLNLDDLAIVESSEEDIAKYSQLELPISKKVVSLKFETPRIMDNIHEKAKEYEKKTGAKNAELLYTIYEMVDLIDGKKPNYVTFLDWIKNLPMADTNAILNYLDRLNGLFGVDLRYPVKCRVCSLDYSAVFKSNREFFRPALD